MAKKTLMQRPLKKLFLVKKPKSFVNTKKNNSAFLLLVRFSDDSYDRIWVPAINRAGFTVLTNDESLPEVSLDDSPPRAVFDKAFATNSTSTYITLGTNLPTTEVPIYMNVYFTEVSELDSTQKRSIYEC